MDSDDGLPRAQRRLLRRIFNGRTEPLAANGRAFLNYRQASAYLLSLEPAGRDDAYEQLKAAAKAGD